MEGLDQSQNGQLPKSITLDGKEYSIKDTPELQGLLLQITAAVSQTEKKKLYDTIESYKKSNSDLSQKNTQLNTEIIRLSSQQTQPPVQNTPVANPQPVVPGQQLYTDANGAPVKNPDGTYVTKDDVAEILSSVFNSKLPEVLQRSLAPFQDRLASLESVSLQEYRNKLLAQHGDSIMPELVKGNTKEELDASVALAKELRQKYGTPVVQQPVQTVVVPDTNQPAPVAQPGAGDPTQQQQTVMPRPSKSAPPADRGPLVDKLKNMNNEDFAKNREKMLAELENQYK